MRSSWTLLVGVVSTRFQDLITVSKKLGNTVQPVIGLDFFFICHRRCRQRCVVVSSGERGSPAWSTRAELFGDCMRWAHWVRLVADVLWSSACGCPVVVCLRMAQGRLLADGPGSSADGPGSSAGWPWSSADGRGRLRMAGFQTGSSACGWPVVVWPLVVCSRMARWSSARGWPVVVCSRMARWSSAGGWPRVVCLWMAQGRLRMASRLSNRLPRGSRHPVGSSP